MQNVFPDILYMRLETECSYGVEVCLLMNRAAELTLTFAAELKLNATTNKVVHVF